MKIFVVGDVILDMQLQVSPRDNYEGAALCSTGKCWDYFPGGAANVAVLLREMGHEVSLFGLTGHGGAACELDDTLYGIRADLKNLLTATTTKMRFYDGDKMFRFDCENPREERWAVEKCLRTVLETPPDCVVFSDYGKGVFGLHAEEAVQQIIKLGIPTVVDPKGGSYSHIWNGATVATPNVREAELLELDTEAVVTTQGGESVVITHADGKSANVIPVPGIDVVQIVGAGDAFAASIAGSLAKGLLLVDAVEKAIEYASLYVSLPRALAYK